MSDGVRNVNANLEKYANSEEKLFTKATREILLDLGKQLGLDMDAPEIIELTRFQLAKKIWNAMSKPLIEEGGEVKQKEEKVSRPTAFRYTAKFPTVNLTPSGVWGGKRRRVNLPRPMREEDSRSNAAKFIGWNGSGILVQYEVEVDIPYPHFEALKNTVQQVGRTVLKSHEDGTKYYDLEWTSQRRVPMQDMGVTPGTENLPESLTHYYQNYFRGGVRPISDFSDRDLSKLCQMLSVRYNARDREDTELSVLEILGNPHQVKEAA